MSMLQWPDCSDKTLSCMHDWVAANQLSLSLAVTAVIGVLVVLQLYRRSKLCQHPSAPLASHTDKRGGVRPARQDKSDKANSTMADSVLRMVNDVPVLGQQPRGCDCYLDLDYFIDKLPSTGTVIQRHLDYESDQAFVKKYASFLRRLSGEETHELLALLRKEKQRRMTEHETYLQRKQTFSRLFKPGLKRLCPDQTCFDPRFLELLELAEQYTGQLTPAAATTTATISRTLPAYSGCEDFFSDAISRDLITCAAEGVYAFPCLSDAYCRAIENEVERVIDAVPPELRGRINTMNNRGIMFDEAGLTDIFSSPMLALVRPLVACCFGWSIARLDSHRVYTVDYKAEEERSLALHYDNAEVTMNISINEGFDGGELMFRGENSKPPQQPMVVDHRRGYALLHRGCEWHQASSVSHGRRTNVIMWFRSSEYRQEHGCPMCRGRR